MNDIASQCMLKWARQGPDKKILSSEDFSRLTLDTIALCAMDYRFNSFYQEEPNPFVQAMTNDLLAKSRGMQLSGMLYKFLPGRAEALQKDHDYMTKTGESIVQHRRENPTEKKDLLNSLLYGKDPKTGYTMRDELIVANMRTFLVAGQFLHALEHVRNMLTCMCRTRNNFRASDLRIRELAEESIYLLRRATGS